MITTKDEFKEFVKEIEGRSDYKKPIGFGIARVDLGEVDKDAILQATYPVVNWNENYGSGAIFLETLYQSGVRIDKDATEFTASINRDFVKNALDFFTPFIDETGGDSHKNIQVLMHLEQLIDMYNYKICFIFEDEAPKSVEAVYLKLYALSLQKAPLRSLNLDGAFGILKNVAWSGNEPIELEWLRENEIELKLTGEYPYIDSVDKFPRFLQHIIPAENTRILDNSRVRFGARVAAGTTVMPGASYINFNAGTLGAVMVEGRISSSAIVGNGSDIGGGASILGVLSGTDGNPISIGENTLLGANSTTGIPLGDGCVVDGGVAIFAGTKVFLSDIDANQLNEINKDANLKEGIIKAKELAGLNGIHFRVDSQSGKVVAKRSTKEVKLNDELH